MAKLETPVVSEQLYEAVARKIGELILSHRYTPGTRLPPERVLSDRLGVGRSTLREALVSLAALGVLEIRQGRGVFVKDLPVALIASRLSRMDDAPSLRDVWEARMAIEVMAAEVAALRRTEADLAAMEKAVLAMEAALARGEPGVEEDTLFHLHLLRAAHNAVLTQLGEELGGLSLRARRLALSRPGRPASSSQEHRAIFAAIRDQDPKEAARAVRLHLEYGLQLTMGLDQREANGHEREEG